MAEVIGILSGAITFVDSGIKVANLLSSLKNAPKRIAAYREELQDMVQLVNTIKNDLDRLSNGTGWIPLSLISQSDLDELQRYMQEAADVTEQVEAFLDVATASPQAGRMEKSWKAVRARKLQGEITARLQRMGSLKASIHFWFNRQNYLISAGQFGSNIHISRSIQALQDRLDSMEGVLRTATSSAEVSISAAVQRSQDAVVAVVQDEIRMLHQSSHHNQSQLATSSFERRLTKISSPVARCTCKRRSSTYLSLGPVYFRDDQRHIHEKRCPLRQLSNRRMLFGLRLSLCHLQFIGSFGARGFSLAPQVKLPGRVVDVMQSSTFNFMGTTLSKFREVFFLYDNPAELFRELCDQLITGLTVRFDSFDGFADDQGQDGRTLLHDFIAFIITRGVLLCTDHTTAFGAIESVIALLVHYGADPNSVMFNASYDGLRADCVAPMDMAILNREIYGYKWRSNHTERQLLEVALQEHGCELSEYRMPMVWSYSTILLCFHDPEFAIDLGFPSYCLPIFRKSLVGLSGITAEGHDWNDYDFLFPAPVQCALCWVDGLKYFLDCGVDYRAAVQMALDSDLTAALQLLITHGCPAFFKIQYRMLCVEVEGSLLHFGASFNIVLPQVARSRRLLLEYGQRVLPESWERNHLQYVVNQGVLLDQHALHIWNALENSNHSPPEFLWPGTAASVYHTLTERVFSIWHLKTRAECLWETGFRDISVVDSQGWSPIDIALDRGYVELCMFFISKGVRPPPDALWMCTRSLPNFSTGIIPPRWMMEPASTLDHDECTCFCSIAGCTPASILVRKRDLGFAARRRILGMYANNLPPETREGCHMAYMRLEIFERLGMAHTCCRYKSSNKNKDRHKAMWETPHIDEIEEIRAEDHVLHRVLEECMMLLDRLRRGFQGRFRDFLHGIRGAVDLLLPYEDFIEEENHVDFRSNMSMNEDASSSQLSAWIDPNRVCDIVRHYHGISACLSPYIEANMHSGLSKSLVDYIPESQGAIECARSLAHCSPEYDDKAYLGYLNLYPKFPRRLTFESRKKAIINDLVHVRMIPLCVAKVIRDLTIDRKARIPQEILDLLERKKMIQEVRLPTIESKEPEDLFGEGIGVLAL